MTGGLVFQSSSCQAPRAKDEKEFVFGQEYLHIPQPAEALSRPPLRNYC